LAAAAFAALSGCHETPTAQSQPPLSQASASANAASAIRQQLSERNYGQAAQLAATAVSSDPNNPDLHYLHAQAEGYLGNAGNAVAALQRAVVAGLADPPAAFSNPAFDSIRDDAVFQEALGRLSPPAVNVTQARKRDGSSTRAGDVEIRESGGRETVRAGDVQLGGDQ
jgi:Flp pilus assembly protein TadD